MSGVNEDDDAVQLVANNGARRRQLVIAGFLTVVIAVALGSAVDGGISIARAIETIAYYAILSVSIIVIPSRLGTLYAQPFLVVTSSGVDYGGREFIPWTAIRRIKRRKRLFASPEDEFEVVGWKPRSWFARLGFHGRAPLSYFDSHWRSSGAESHIRRVAPSLEVDDD